MRNFCLMLFLALSVTSVLAQESSIYQKGVTAQKNLDAIGSLSPYAPGGMGFDNRYQGLKGSPRLFDTLLVSLINLKGQEDYFEIKSDIDVVRNTILFIHPRTGQLLALPCDRTNELVVKYQGKDMIFRTTAGKNFDKEIKEPRFFQVLSEGKYPLLKMPVKIFTEAAYKGAYSPDRRYDEYETKYRYYILGTDNIFHQVQLNKKALVKLFPDKKDIITSTADAGSFKTDEEMVISVLEKL